MRKCVNDARLLAIGIILSRVFFSSFLCLCLVVVLEALRFWVDRWSVRLSINILFKLVLIVHNIMISSSILNVYSLYVHCQT